MEIVSPELGENPVIEAPLHVRVLPGAIWEVIGHVVLLVALVEISVR